MKPTNEIKLVKVWTSQDNIKFAEINGVKYIELKLFEKTLAELKKILNRK